MNWLTQTYRWGPLFLLFLDFGLPLLLFLPGAWMLWSGAFRKPRHSVPTGKCSACGYDVSQTPAPACPECGQKRDDPTFTPKRKIKKLRSALGLLLCLPACLVLCFSLWYFPATYLSNQKTEHALTILDPILVRSFEDGWNGGPRHATPPDWAVWLTTQGLLALGHSPPDPKTIKHNFLNYPRIYSHTPSSLDNLDALALHTAVNWAWHPTLNYMSYMPLESRVYLTLDASTPLTPQQTLALSQVGGLKVLSTSSHIKFDDQALTQLSLLLDPSINFHISHFAPDPSQAHLWDAPIPKLPQIGSLSIRPSAPIPQGIFQVLQNNRRLYGIGITDADAPTDQPHMLQGISRLSTLSTLQHFTLDSGTPAQRAQVFSLIPSMPKLLRLSLRGLDIPPSQLLTLQSLKELRHLEIGFQPNTSSTDQDLQWLTAFPQLDSLSLCNMPNVKGTCLSSTHAPRYLTKLQLDNVGIDESSLLALRHSSITELRLKNCNITSQALANFLKQQIYLHTLDYDQPATQSLCEQIALTNIHTLSIRGIDDQALQTLFKAHTYLKITLHSPRLSPQLQAQIKSGNDPHFRNITIIR